MVLVSYSDSESDTVQAEVQCSTTNTPQASRKRKIGATLGSATNTTKSPPALPASFHSLYATNARTSTTDDPSLHGGRKRQVVHVQGNWPSHVFLEWLPTKVQLGLLDHLIEQTEQVITANRAPSKHGFHFNNFLRSSLSAQLPLHVSLSAPLVLSTTNKDDFRTALTKTIGAVKIGDILVRPVSLDLVPNFERSRWFLVLRLGQTDVAGLVALLRVCNDICGDFDLPLLYQGNDVVGIDTAIDGTGHGVGRAKKRKGHGNEVADAGSEVESKLRHDVTNAFHISIAWTLEEVSEDARSAIRHIDPMALSKAVIQFDRVKIKIGNVVDDVLL